MKKRWAAAALSAMFAFSAHATVIKLETASGGHFKVFVHNTLCDNKTRELGGGASTYQQLDWRGKCTGSCVDYLVVYDGGGYQCMGKVQVWNSCKSQTIVLKPDGSGGFTVSGSYGLSKINTPSLFSNVDRNGCIRTNDGRWITFDELSQ